MRRRAFLRNAAGAGASLGLLWSCQSRLAAAPAADAALRRRAEASFPAIPNLTKPTCPSLS